MPSMASEPMAMKAGASLQGISASTRPWRRTRQSTWHTGMGSMTFVRRMARCAASRTLCCSGTTCDASGVCVVSQGGACTVDADCPPAASHCLCPNGNGQGVCLASGTPLGDTCNHSDSRASCLCGDGRTDATCAVVGAEYRCCLGARATGCTGQSSPQDCCDVGGHAQGCNPVGGVNTCCISVNDSCSPTAANACPPLKCSPVMHPNGTMTGPICH